MRPQLLYLNQYYHQVISSTGAPMLDLSFNSQTAIRTIANALIPNTKTIDLTKEAQHDDTLAALMHTLAQNKASFKVQREQLTQHYFHAHPNLGRQLVLRPNGVTVNTLVQLKRRLKLAYQAHPLPDVTETADVWYQLDPDYLNYWDVIWYDQTELVTRHSYVLTTTHQPMHPHLNDLKRLTTEQLKPQYTSPYQQKEVN